MTQINKSAKQLLAPIVSNKRVGQYHQIIINIGDVAATCKPGNFVAISVGGDSSRMVLRRAFAISRVSTSTTVGGIVGGFEDAMGGKRGVRIQAGPLAHQPFVGARHRDPSGVSPGVQLAGQWRPGGAHRPVAGDREPVDANAGLDGAAATRRPPPCLRAGRPRAEPGARHANRLHRAGHRRAAHACARRKPAHQRGPGRSRQGRDGVPGVHSIQPPGGAAQGVVGAARTDGTHVAGAGLPLHHLRGKTAAPAGVIPEARRRPLARPVGRDPAGHQAGADAGLLRGLLATRGGGAGHTPRDE